MNASKAKAAIAAAKELVMAPVRARADFAGDFVGATELDESYSYNREQTIITKTYLDGREIARSETPYRRSIDARDARKTGRRLRVAYA